MLRVGETSTIKFNVDIHGTGAPPEVKVVLNVGDHELGFKCTKIGDEWHAEVKIPTGTEPGMYDMRVEVAINNRLFVPVKRKVEIGGQEVHVEAAIADEEPKPIVPPTPVKPVIPPPPAPLPVVEPPEPEVVHPKTEAKKVEVQPPAPKKVVKIDTPPKRTVVVEPKKQPLIKSFTPESTTPVAKPKPVPIVPKKVAAPPPPAKKVPLNIPPQNIQLKGKVAPIKAKPRVIVPKQPVQESGPIRISISDIVEESNRRFPLVEQSPSYISPIAPVKSLNITQGAPVTLTKGAVVYE